MNAISNKERIMAENKKYVEIVWDGKYDEFGNRRFKEAEKGLTLRAAGGNLTMRVKRGGRACQC